MLFHHAEKLDYALCQLGMAQVCLINQPKVEARCVPSS